MHEWEDIGASTWRMRVPGGWLYRHDAESQDWDTEHSCYVTVALSESMCFVPEGKRDAT